MRGEEEMRGSCERGVEKDDMELKNDDHEVEKEEECRGGSSMKGGDVRYEHGCKEG